MLRSVEIQANQNGIVEPRGVIIHDWLMVADPDTGDVSQHGHRERTIPAAALQRIIDVINTELGGPAKALERVNAAKAKASAERAAREAAQPQG